MASIVSGVIEKINVGGTSHAIASTAYGYCTTAANEPAKTVEMTDFKLEQGVTIHVKFQYDNTALTPTLNVNGKGAKSIALGGSKADVDGGVVGWRAGDIVTFTYDGDNRWVINNSAYATMAGSILSGNIHPTIVKEWTDSSFYGANITGQDVHDLSTFWMLSVRPDSWYEPWVVRFKITTTCPAAANYYSVTYCMYSGRADGMVVFNWNERYDHAHYYTNIRTLKKAGFDAGLGHAIGINLYASNNYTNANYYRSFKLEYYDCDNCTVTILDNPIKWANWPDGTTTNYNGNNNANAVDRGLQESGDANSYDLIQMSNTYIKNGSFRFPGISLFGYDREGYAQPFSLYQSGYDKYTTSISNKATRIYNNNGIDWTRGIHYNASGGSWAENADMNISARLAQSAVDLRYTDNCVSTANTTLSMISRKAVYIRGTLDENGLFHVAPIDVPYSNATYCRVWTQDIPTESDPYVYWFVGYPYATSAYQVNLYLENPLYWYHDGKFQKYIEHAESADGVKQIGTTTTGEYPVLFKNTGDTTDETASVKYSNGNNATATANLAFTFNPNTGNLTIPELTIAKKDDNYGIFPHTSNYNQIGKSNLYWYRAYITNYYGTTSHITNWDSGKNIGTEKTSSAAATKGSVNFYNVCAAGGTTTKTTLAANDSTNSNITINLPSTSGTLALVGAAPTAHEHNYLTGRATINSGDASNNDFKSAIRKYFDDNYSTVPRNALVNFYSNAYSNGSEVFGYYLSGYNDNPYGGFFIAHYDTPRYVGLINGSSTEAKLARIDIANTITTNQVMIADGSDGKIKTSGYTIAKSVPSNAKFSDTTYANGTGITIGTGNAINHSNSVTAQTTQAIYPIKIDAQGHISAYGTAVTPVTSVNGHTGSSVNVTASDLGLSSALRFVGITTTDMTGGTASNHSYTGVPGGITSYTTPAQGDVVINSTKQDEWVCTTANGNSSVWERLGSDTSYKIVQTAVTSPTASTTTSTTFIDTISQNANGVISATKKTLPTASSSVAGITTIGASGGAAAYSHTHSYLPLTGGTLSGDLTLKTSSADSPDIVWKYGNTDKEQARIWMGSGGDTKWAPSYRCYKSDGTSLYSGTLVLGDGTGASGTWNITASNATSATTATNLAAAPTITQTGSNPTALTANQTYTLTVGGQTVVFKTPADSNTDTKVTQTYSTTNNSYPLLMTATAGVSATSSRGETTTILNNTLYANPNNGQLNATTFKVNEQVTLNWNTTDQALEFIFA